MTDGSLLTVLADRAEFQAHWVECITDIVLRIVQVGVQARPHGTLYMLRRIIDKNCGLPVDSMHFHHIFEGFRMRLAFSQFEGKMRLFEQGVKILIAECPFEPGCILPIMYDIGIAEEEGAVAGFEAFEQADSSFRDIEKHGIPGRVDLLVTEGFARQLSDFIPESFWWDLPSFQRIKEMCLQVLRIVLVKFRNSELRKSPFRKPVVDIEDDSAKVEDDRIDRFQIKEIRRVV